MKILLHQCCGPCSIYPIGVLKAEGAEVTAYFSNYNIHGIQEFFKRLEAAVAVNKLCNIAQIIDDAYGLKEFMLENGTTPESRCHRCYLRRMRDTAAKAKQLGLGYFTSSLLYSRMQDHAAITEAGRIASDEYGVEFIYRDFREGWDEGITLSKDAGVYRQNYCGCIFSEEERFAKQVTRKITTLTDTR